jgi:hypothetical protein
VGSTSLQSSSSSPNTWDTISQWLNNCNPRDHPLCYQHLSSASPALLKPTRLLYVRTPGRVRLVDVTYKLRKMDYITLSHCWGTAQIFTLTKATAKELYTGIYESLLPLSFRDAIAVVRRLKINYIWIDSLCIYQDDEIDWEKESERMASVYSGGYCNLAATAAHDSSEGLFFPRNISLTQPLAISGPWTIEHSTALSPVSNRLLYSESYWSDIVKASPLLKRGWVVQERILSRRTIHFSRPQIFWECSHTTACEVFPTGLPRNPPNLGFTKRDVSGYASHPLYEQAWNPLIDPWNSIVELYSHCHLTFKKDKFVAISGVVNLYKSKNDRGRYLAGLWEVDFFRHLVWEVSENAQFPPFYRAPSWSWASIDSGVQYVQSGRCTVSDFVRLISADVTDDRADLSTEKFSRWYARIQAPIYRVKLGPTHDRNRTFTLQPGSDRQRSSKMRVSLDCGTSNTRLTSHVYLLPALLVKPSSIGSAANRICGIIMDLTGSFRGEFRRIGFFEVPGLAEGSNLDPLLRGPSSLPYCSYETRRTVYSDGKETHLYTFTIV